MVEWFQDMLTANQLWQLPHCWSILMQQLLLPSQWMPLTLQLVEFGAAIRRSMVTISLFQSATTPSGNSISAFDRKLLALYLAIRHFRYFLEGQDLVAYSDHKPLTFAFAKVSEPWSPRQQRQLDYISEYTTNVQHIAGKDNHVVDTLSRAVVNAISLTELGLDFLAMAEAQ